MIQIHNPGAVVFVETVLLAAAIVVVHQVTRGRIWPWLRHHLATGARGRLTACALLLVPVAVAVLGRGGAAPSPGQWTACALFALLAGIVLAAVVVLHRRRRAQEAEHRRYQGLIDRLKTSSAPDAAITVRAAIQALNRSGVTGVDLNACRLPGADLRQARLYGARLHQAELPNADLRGVGFTGADLTEARLAGADLRDAFLYRTDLRGADMRLADLSGADLREADLRGARLDGCLLADARLEDARLEGAAFRDACLKNTQVSVAQLLKTRTLARAALDPHLHTELVAAENRPGGLARRLLRLDGIVPITD